MVGNKIHIGRKHFAKSAACGTPHGMTTTKLKLVDCKKCLYKIKRGEGPYG